MTKRVIGWVAIGIGCCMGTTMMDDKSSKNIDYLHLKQVVEGSTNFFDPAFIRSTYKVLVFNIDNYKVSIATYRDSIDKNSIVRDVPFYKLKIGKFPRFKGGEFKVVFSDSIPVRGKKRVFSYSMESPLHQRIERGSRKGFVKMKEGSFDIPVPDSTFQNIRLLHKGETVFHDALPRR